MGEVDEKPLRMSFFPSFMRGARWMRAVVNFPVWVQTHRYFWQAFDVAQRWAVPLQWPLNGVNTPFTVQIEAAAPCFIECLIAHRFTQNAPLLQERCWPAGPNLSGKWSSYSRFATREPPSPANICALKRQAIVSMKQTLFCIAQYQSLCSVLKEGEG